MLVLPSLVVFFSLLQASISIPILDAKPKPVRMIDSCIQVITLGHQDQRSDDIPIILIHGTSQNKESWHGIIEVLALDTGKKVCAVDLRNHGESPWNDDEYDIEAMTEDIKHYIDQIKAPKAIVLGHSMGGKIAVHLALNYPEIVEKVIVEDMRPNGFPPEIVKEMQFLVTVMTELDRTNILQGVSEIEAKKAFLKVINEQYEKMNVTLRLDDPNTVPIKCSDGKCQLTFNFVLYDALKRNMTELFNESSGRYDGPALFIYGGKSPFKVGEDESNIKKLFPNAKLVEVAEADHFVHEHRKFMTEVIKFINN